MVINIGKDLNGFQHDQVIRCIKENLRYGDLEGEIDVSDFKNPKLGFNISKVKFKIVIEGE